MILESIVTSVDRDGRVNVAPMGPRVDPSLASGNSQGSYLVLRPFQSSRTYRNLIDTGMAVVHVTDDSELFARAAVDAIGAEEMAALVRRLDESNHWVLRDCHRWLAVTVESIGSTKPRVDMNCRIVREAIVRPFFGFNRAKHAVIEAAILATRTHLLAAEEIQSEIDRLRPLIDKTAGAAERNAFQFLQNTIQDRLAGHDQRVGLDRLVDK